ncbi:MAG: hypothetical protein ACKPKO_32845 [Candidatus Fonsibacter sp.]
MPIIYEPEDNTTKVQLNPTGGQDLSGTYYHVHNYIHFINLINKAFDSALNNLRKFHAAERPRCNFNRCGCFAVPRL